MNVDNQISMKTILAVFFMIGIVSITSIQAYAIDTASIDKGSLTIEPSTNVISTTTTQTDNFYNIEGDHTITSTENYNGIVEDNESLAQRVRSLLSSTPSVNAPPSQAGAIITQNGHEFLDLNNKEGCNENIIYRTSASNITVEGKIGDGIINPTYKGIPLDPIEIPKSYGEECPWNKVIIDIPRETNGSVIIEQTEDEFFYYVTYRVPK